MAFVALKQITRPQNILDKNKLSRVSELEIASGCSASHAFLLNSGLCFCFLLKQVYKHQRQNASTRADGSKCYFICHYLFGEYCRAGRLGLQAESWKNQSSLVAELRLSTFFFRKENSIETNLLLFMGLESQGRQTRGLGLLFSRMVEGSPVLPRHLCRTLFLGAPGCLSR